MGRVCRENRECMMDKKAKRPRICFSGGGFRRRVERLAGTGMILASAVLAATAGHASAGDFSAWAHSADFRLNTKANGADIRGDVADFPLLIRLDSALFPFEQAKADGGDIRFSDEGGSALAYQVEEWDAALRRAEIRVRVPLVKGGSDTGFVRMHWGNAAAGSSSDGKAVFDPALGFAGVWHMQGDTLKDATGNAGNGDGTWSEKAVGLIAEGRALTGNSQGILVPAVAALNPVSAITVSAWIRADTWNGGNRAIFQKGMSTIQYALVQDPATDSLILTWGGLSQGATLKGPLPAAGAWHHLAATYDGSSSRLYLDGALVKSQGAAGSLLSTDEELCLGCKSAAGRPRNSFKGLLDEVAISGTAQSADFLKLAYANQRAQQVLVLHPALVECRSDFGVSADASVAEGAEFTLRGRAECASGFSWYSISGPAPRILDPEVKELTVTAPRIDKDTVLIYRFTARFGESYRNADVAIRVREAIPDPQVSLPAVASWNGVDSLVLRPTFLNLKAIKASRDSVIRFAWTLSAPIADTAWRDGALVLRSASNEGTITVGLCADNGGTPSCAYIPVNVVLPVGVAAGEKALPAAWRPRAGRDANGRWRGSRDGTAAGFGFGIR